MKKLIALLLSVLLLASTAAIAEETTPAWAQPYDETVTVTFGRSGSTQDPDFPEGESIDSNAYTDWVKEQFNIDFQNEWLVDNANGDYTTRVNLAMTTGEFPDVFMVTGDQAKMQIRQLIDAGYIQDLSAAYDEYASDMLRDIVDSYGGLDVIAPATVRDEDDKIYAFGNMSPGGEYELVWIRTDWLEKLNLEKPTTFSELMDVARAFVANKLGGDNTIGFEITNSLNDQYNTACTPSYLWHNFKAYPGLWYQDESGDYVYGSVQPQVKEGLQFMAQLYSEGLLDKEFVTKDYMASLAAGRAGITFGPWWIGAWPINNCKINDPSSYWEPIWVLDDDGKVNVVSPDATNENVYYVVSSQCEHPEVLIKMMNVSAEQQNTYGIEEYDTYAKIIPHDVDVHYNSIGYYRLDWGAWPLALKIRYNDQLARMGVVWNALVDDLKAGKEIPYFAMESFNGEKIVAYMNGDDDSDDGQHVYTKYLALNLIKDLDATEAVKQQVYNPAPTDTMELAWTNLQDMEKQVFAGIIMGEKSIDDFDTFVSDWMAQGGAAITEEVNAQAKGE